MVFARAGWEAAMYDAVEGAANKALGSFAEGSMSWPGTDLWRTRRGPQRACARQRASPTRSTARATVQENVPETVERSARSSPSSTHWLRPMRSRVLTSAIVASLFTENLAAALRCLVAHPVNPPHLVPIVELVGAPWTAPGDHRAREAGSTRRSIGADRRAPRDRSFILNRLAGALLAEAFGWSARAFVSPQISARPSRTGSGCAGQFMGAVRDQSN